MLFLEKRLHAGEVPPSLKACHAVRVERLLFSCLILLRIADRHAVSGVFFSEDLFGKAFPGQLQTVFAVLSWLIFGGLLLGHWKFGWRGRLAITLDADRICRHCCFLCGQQVVLEVILQRV